MRRAVARFTFVTLLGTLAMLLGVVTSMTLTPPGRDLLARAVSTLLGRLVLGRVEVGYISGSFLYDLTLKRLVVRDTSGVVLADLPRMRVGYRLPGLVTGSIVLTSVTLDRPVIQLIRHRNGRMNFEEVLRLGKGAPGRTSPLIELRNVHITDGTLRIALPWNPPQSARTATQRDSALAAERARPGRLIEATAEGFRRVIVLDRLSTVMSRMRITTPDHKPFTVDLDSLATHVSDPGVTVRDAVGRIRLAGDSAVFSFSRAALPNTIAHGGGAVTWPHDTILFDFQFASPQVDLTDLRWVSPQFPAMTGRGTLVAHSVTGARVDYAIEDLHLRHGPERIDGRLTAVTDQVRGLGVRDMKIALQQVDLDAARAYLDSLPFHGTLSGTLAGSGLLTALDVSVNWDFADALVPGRPVTHLEADGRVRTTKRQGLVFDSVRVRRSDIDLRTVRTLARAMILPGRLGAVGVLDGPMKDASFTGTLRHQDGDRPVSVLQGYVRLDTRFDTLGIETDVALAPLAFDGIRRAFPSLAAKGELRGQFRSQGTLGSLAVDATLSGQIGDVTARGTVTLLPPRFGADDLHLRFAGLDLAALRGAGPATRLDGELTATGIIDTLRAPEGMVHLALARSAIRAFTLDTLHADIALRDSTMTLDSAHAEWNGAHVDGSGTLGWARPRTGRMIFRLAADSLVAFDSLLLATTHQVRDTTPTLRPLNGRAEASLTLSGSVDTLEAAGDFALHALEFQQARSEEVSGTFGFTGGARPTLRATVQSDSVRYGQLLFSRIGLGARGPSDSIGWSVGSGIGSAARIDAIGSWRRRDSTQVIGVDTLRARLASHTWRLIQPTVIALSDSAPIVRHLRVRTLDGTGLIDIDGAVPGKGSGHLELEAVGVALQDAYSLAGRDTAGVAGEVGMDVALGGTSAAPTLRGTVSLADARVGDAQVPFAEGVLDYSNRRLDANLVLWKTGVAAVQIEAQLPIDLGVGAIAKRRVDGPLLVHARADSVDLALLEAATTSIQRVSGTLSADMSVGGRWNAPELSGFLAVRNGAMSLPSLGVRYDTVRGRVDFASDSAHLNGVRLTSDGGTLDVTGSIHVHLVGKAELGLHLEANRFQLIDDRTFLSLTATGGVDLTGPFYGATLTGRATANDGVLYFADLISKRIIDLDDPSNADLVDTTLLRRKNLGGAFQARFLQELRVNGFNLEIGEDFWLRSGEANVKLNGTVQADKVQREYRLNGTLNAERGTYTLKIGPVSRDFTVERGAVRYLGTPDLNAELDIEAQHVVRTVSNQEIPVIARISGTLLVPKLSLESTQRPPISETDLISYLITGAPAAEANVLGQGGVVQSAVTYLTSALSTEVERALVADLGLPIDLLEIRPGVTQGGGRLSASSLSQVTAGWQIGNKTFLTLNAGFCSQQFVSDLRYEGIGASIERRFSRAWRVKASIEPTYQTCGTTTGVDYRGSTSPYQVGADLLWEREF